MFQGKSQGKSTPGQSGLRLDQTPANSKTPSANQDNEQRIGTPGETVPIVFGKRVSEIGGVWVQPPLVKSGTKLFVGSFLYTISQGQIASSPVKYRTWTGTRNLAYIADQSITLAHDYATASSLASAPNVCPIGGTTLFCGVETYSYLDELQKAEVGAQHTFAYRLTQYVGAREITRGIGNTTNIVATYTGADVKVFNSETGADVTSNWLAFTGFSPSTVFAINYNSSTGGGYAANSVRDFTITLGYLAPNPAYIAALGITPTGHAIFQNTIQNVYTQYNPSLPVSTGTLYGVQNEIVVTPYANPAITPTANNSAYADITFLRVTGNIYDSPSEGNYPTTTRQLFIYYEQGVNVDLYSLGLGTTGASNQIVDLFMYLFTIYKRATGATMADIASPIYTANMVSIAGFCTQYGLFYNGILGEPVNIIEFASAIAPFFLLAFLSVGGQYRFEPLLPLAGSQIKVTALTPVTIFTEDQILPGSFKKDYKSLADRQDYIAVMLWRESNPSEVGIQRTTQVAYTTTALDAPVEQFDMTEFCCSSAHAALYGKYELAKRKYTTHSIVFDTALITTGLKPTDIIKIVRQRVTSAGDNRSETEWYQITSVTYSTAGISTIEADHFPVNGSDIAEISNSIINGSFRVL